MKLTSEQHQFVLKSIREYISISKNEHYTPADLDHSSLFERLLTNPEEVFEFPPPKAYSYPWVDLVKNKISRTNTHFVETGYLAGKVVLSQSPWNIIERISDIEFIVEYAGTHPWKARIIKDDKNDWHPWSIELI